MNSKAKAILLELLFDIIQTNGIYSEAKVELLQKLVNEIEREDETPTSKKV